MSQQSLFSLRFPTTVGYSNTVVCTAAEVGNTRRNAHKGQVLVVMPAELPGKVTGKYELCHTGITSVTEEKLSDGNFRITVNQNMVVYLPKEANNAVEDCRSISEVVAACGKIGIELSGEFDFLDYSLTQDRGVEAKHMLLGNPRRVRMTKADVKRLKRAK